MTTDREALAELAKRLPAVVEGLRVVHRCLPKSPFADKVQEFVDELAQLAQIAVLAVGGGMTQATPDHLSCHHCSLRKTPEGHDGCLGTLCDPEIMNACCGHGDIEDAYIQYWPGDRRIAGEEALQEQARLVAVLAARDISACCGAPLRADIRVMVCTKCGEIE